MARTLHPRRDKVYSHSHLPSAPTQRRRLRCRAARLLTCLFPRPLPSHTHRRRCRCGWCAFPRINWTRQTLVVLLAEPWAEISACAAASSRSLALCCFSLASILPPQARGGCSRLRLNSCALLLCFTSTPFLRHGAPPCTPTSHLHHTGRRRHCVGRYSVLRQATSTAVITNTRLGRAPVLHARVSVHHRGDWGWPCS